MQEKKKEPKFLDLSAHSEVNLKELFERLVSPKIPKKEEEEDNDDNN